GAPPGRPDSEGRHSAVGAWSVERTKKEARHASVPGFSIFTLNAQRPTLYGLPYEAASLYGSSPDGGRSSLLGKGRTFEGCWMFGAPGRPRGGRPPRFRPDAPRPLFPPWP